MSLGWDCKYIKEDMYIDMIEIFSFGEGWGGETKNPNLSIGISL